MLYATGLTQSAVLALAFDVRTPFSKIRAQAYHLAKSLSTPPPDSSELEKSWVLERDLHEEETDETSSSKSSQQELQDKSAGDSQAQDSPPESRQDSSEQPPFERAPTNQEIELKKEAEPVSTELDLKESLKKEHPENDRQQGSTGKDSLASSLNWQQEISTEVEAHYAPLIIPLPNQEKAQVAAMELESASNILYHLTYACILIPRLPKHEISDELPDHLNEWIPQICVAFGWRLESIDTRPDHVQWVVAVPPNTSPGAVIGEIRRITSQRIFAEFPWYEQENPSGDFWAPGFMVVNHTEVLPQQVVAAYIRQTRKRQGLGESD